MAGHRSGVDADLERRSSDSVSSIRRSFDMRSHRSVDLTALRATVVSTLGLPVSLDDYELEQACRTYLSDSRWPGGVECPRCNERSRLLWLASRSKWHCYGCRYQFSVTAGTLFHSSHLPVWKWFVAVRLMLDSPGSLSANELRRTIGGSYKTSWFAAHRIRAALRGHGPALLRSLVEAELHASGVGAGHLPSAKYLPAYLDERRWRALHAGNPHVFRDTISALLQGEGISYDQLVAA
jgi:transposase-like protein